LDSVASTMPGATDDPYPQQFEKGVVELATQAEGVALGDG